MKIFIIHKSENKEIADVFAKVLNETTHSDCLVLKNAPFFWKMEAKKKIKEAQIILFLLGEKSKESPNIEYELKIAKKYNKQIFCLDLKKYYKVCSDIFELENNIVEIDNRLKNSKEICREQYGKPDALMHINEFTKNKELASLIKEVDILSDVIDAINKYNKGEYDIFNMKVLKEHPTLLIEQYKLYLTTSETLVARRQSVNNFYITVNAALITTLTSFLALSNRVEVKTILMFVMSIVGIILDTSWLKILDAYGLLNGSKMKIIRLIEQKLPVILYDREWEVMSDKLNNKKYVSFTDSEKRIPKIFCVIYIFGLIISIIIRIFLKELI